MVHSFLKRRVPQACTLWCDLWPEGKLPIYPTPHVYTHMCHMREKVRFYTQRWNLCLRYRTIWSGVDVYTRCMIVLSHFSRWLWGKKGERSELFVGEVDCVWTSKYKSQPVMFRCGLLYCSAKSRFTRLLSRLAHCCIKNSGIVWSQMKLVEINNKNKLTVQLLY